MLFMGEEWGADQPFSFFCDFAPDLADKVREGRRREFAKFPEFRDEAAARVFPIRGRCDFRERRSRLDGDERPPHANG